MPELIHGFSVQQPWADLLVSGRKIIECRTWWPRVQLPMLLAIHAGKTPSKGAPVRIWEMARMTPGERSARNRLGGIVGVARFVGRIDYGNAPLGLAPRYIQRRFIEDADKHLCPLEWWHDKMCGFEMDRPIRFREIIPCKGALSFFRLPEEVEAAVREAMTR